MAMLKQNSRPRKRVRLDNNYNSNKNEKLISGILNHARSYINKQALSKIQQRNKMQFDAVTGIDGKLSVDMLLQILIRMDSMAIARLRVVCKSWNKLLNSLWFIRFLIQSKNPNHTSDNNYKCLVFARSVLGTNFLDPAQNQIKLDLYFPVLKIWSKLVVDKKPPIGQQPKVISLRNRDVDCRDCILDFSVSASSGGLIACLGFEDGDGDYLDRYSEDDVIDYDDEPEDVDIEYVIKDVDLEDAGELHSQSNVVNIHFNVNVASTNDQVSYDKSCEAQYSHGNSSLSRLNEDAGMEFLHGKSTSLPNQSNVTDVNDVNNDIVDVEALHCSNPISIQNHKNVSGVNAGIDAIEEEVLPGNSINLHSHNNVVDVNASIAAAEALHALHSNAINLHSHNNVVDVDADNAVNEEEVLQSNSANLHSQTNVKVEVSSKKYTHNAVVIFNPFTSQYKSIPFPSRACYGRCIGVKDPSSHKPWDLHLLTQTDGSYFIVLTNGASSMSDLTGRYATYNRNYINQYPLYVRKKRWWTYSSKTNKWDELNHILDVRFDYGDETASIYYVHGIFSMLQGLKIPSQKLSQSHLETVGHAFNRYYNPKIFKWDGKLYACSAMVSPHSFDIKQPQHVVLQGFHVYAVTHAKDGKGFVLTEIACTPTNSQYELHFSRIRGIQRHNLNITFAASGSHVCMVAACTEMCRDVNWKPLVYDLASDSWYFLSNSYRRNVDVLSLFHFSLDLQAAAL